MTETKKESAVMTVKELCEVLEIGKPAAYALCHREDFPAIKIGKSFKIPRKRFYEWLDSMTERGDDRGRKKNVLKIGC